MKQFVKLIFLMAMLMATTMAAQDILLLMDDAVVPPLENGLTKGEATLTDRFQDALSDGNIYISLLLALVAGLLTSMSPCVYPLIPITLTVLGARGASSHRQGFLRALVYVLGMACLYTALGAIFASLGMMLGSIMQHPALLVIMALFFAFMAFSILGFYTITVPQPIAKRLLDISGSGFRGAFLMGLFAGILAAPCTGPVLGVILGLIASAKDIELGTLLMFIFALGMGTPFLVLGTFSHAISRMPKSGDWMDNVKNIFGAGMLFAALYYAALALPGIRNLLSVVDTIGLKTLWLLLGASILLLVVHKKDAPQAVRSLQNVVGALLFATISAALLLPTTTKNQEVRHGDLTWHVIDTKTTDPLIFDRLVDSARAEARPILVDFYADWCVACVQFDKITFVDPAVSQALSQFTLIRIDATTASDYISELQTRFQVIGLPLIAVIDRRGETKKVQGFLEPEAFLPILTQALRTGE